MLAIDKDYEKRLKDWLSKLELSSLDVEKIITAFTHPSYKGIDPMAEDYERFEFLGDSVLDLIAAEELVRNYVISEGAMTERRKQIVNNEYLSHVFDRLKLLPLIRAAVKYQPSIKDKANFIEALFGAVFLDKGYDTCKQLWDRIQKKMGINKKKVVIPPTTAEEKYNKDVYKRFYKDLGLVPKNAKSLLQELCQKQGLPIPEYELVDKKGPDHAPIFVVKVSLIPFNRPPRHKYVALGEGKSKKHAELKAAEKICEQIYLDYIPSD